MSNSTAPPNTPITPISPSSAIDQFLKDDPTASEPGRSPDAIVADAVDADTIAVSPPPPKQRITLHIRRNKPSLAPLITRLRYPLAPLRPLPCGAPHPAFPANLINFHLLTEAQLDSIATYYHQRAGPYSPSRFWTTGYPSEMRWDDEWLAHVGQRKREGEDEKEGVERRIGIKRRKVGRFIGLRACDTPADELAEYQRWKRLKEESRIKGDDLAF